MQLHDPNRLKSFTYKLFKINHFYYNQHWFKYLYGYIWHEYFVAQIYELMLHFKVSSNTPSLSNSKSSLNVPSLTILELDIKNRDTNEMI